MRKNENKPEISNACPEAEHWVKTHQRSQIVRGKKTLVTVHGHCRINPSHFEKLARDEEIDIDILYFAVTLFAETRSENTLSRTMIAWIIRNRFEHAQPGKSYKDIVTKRAQFSCWLSTDNNYRHLKHPGRENAIEMAAWKQIKRLTIEIAKAPYSQNPIPDVLNYFSGNPDVKKNPWQKNHFDIPGVPNFHFIRKKK